MTLDLLRGYRSIIFNSYFERLWIVQELARAKDIVILLGRDSGAEQVSWRQFVLVFTVIMLETTIVATSSKEALKEIQLRLLIQERKMLRQLVEIRSGKVEYNILSLIEAFSHFKCADLRDKLFALRDIRPLGHQPFEIDYRKTVLEVYGDFLVECLQKGCQQGRLSVRQADILVRMSEIMEVGFEIQSDEAESIIRIVLGKTIHGDVALSAASRDFTENLEVLVRSVSYRNTVESRLFGPSYDPTTGDHVDFKSPAYSGQDGPTVRFRVANSVDLSINSQKARDKFNRRLNAVRGTVPAAAKVESKHAPITDTQAENIPKDIPRDGYTEYLFRQGNTSEWGLPKLESDSDSDSD